jgi:hypothetical protein
MAIFFRYMPKSNIKASAEEELLNSLPDSSLVADQHSAETSGAGPEVEYVRRFSIRRFVCAIFLLIAVIIGYVVTASDPRFTVMANKLADAFTLVFGIILGILTAEATER